MLLGGVLSHSARGADVHRIRVDGVINPVSAKFIMDAVDRAEVQHAEALVIELDTPGGLLEATRDIVQRFLAADVPVMVYVAPDGARAGSAGVFITLAAHIAAMAPGTNIGAAHPVSIGGGGLPGAPPDTAGGRVMSDKVTNDAAALIRSIAETRGRNVEWAEKAVRTSDAITARDAAAQGVVDFLAPNLDSLLVLADGKTVKLKTAEKTLQTRGAAVTTFKMTWRERFFDRIADPNLAYIFLMVGIYGILFELYNPGAVLPGVLGGLGLLLAFFAFQALPVNAVGILLILFGIILLILEIKVVSYGMLTVSGAVSLLLGSLMLFEPSVPSLRVSLGVIIPTVVATTLFVLFALGMGVRAQRRRVETGREGLIGMTGIALDEFKIEDLGLKIKDGESGAKGSPNDLSGRANWHGTVLVNGEYWKATSSQPLSQGIAIRVNAVEGMILKVTLQG